MVGNLSKLVFRGGISAAIVGAASGALILVPWISDFDGLRTLFTLTIIGGIFGVFVLHRMKSTNEILLYWGASLWGLLILAEGILVRSGTAITAAEGEFQHAAAGEAVVWLTCFCFMVGLSLWSPGILRNLFASGYRWISVFGILALLSVLYSTAPTYSFLWVFKLILVILVLNIWVSGIENLHDFTRAVFVMHHVFLILSLLPFVQILEGPELLFAGYRLGGVFSPTGVSATAGTLTLLALMLMKLNGRYQTEFKISVCMGLMIMLMGMGKTSIVACLVAGMGFFFVLGNVKASVGFILIMAMLVLVGVSADLPMVGYVQKYQSSEMGATLSGRSELWTQSLPVIMDKFFLGHGYVTSKFASLNVEDLSWDAGQLHNAFLEVLYNNGFVGFVVLVMLNGILIKNFLRSSPTILHKDMPILRSGLLSLYCFIFINGLFNSSFGGRPHSQFVLFLTIVMLSQKYKELSEEMSGERPSESVPVRKSAV
ncbi:MAG: O-antigen ligase family protein [Nitrospirales bacterium]